MPGMEATQMPNKRLEAENRKPTAKAGLFLIKEIKFLIMIQRNGSCELSLMLSSSIAKAGCDYLKKAMN